MKSFDAHPLLSSPIRKRQARMYVPLLGTALMSIGLTHGALGAGSFAYVNGELLACFRVDGGADDLVLNLGPVTALRSAAWGSTLAIPAVTPERLHLAFPSLDGLKWSVLGAVRGNPEYAQFALQTIWATSPGTPDGGAGAVWKRQGPFTQGAAASQIDAIGLGAVVYGSQHPGGEGNSPAAIVISSADVNSYSSAVGVGGNLADTFQGSVEGLAPEGFEQAADPIRSMLYELEPSSGSPAGGPGRVLGTFEFGPGGSLTFTAGVPPSEILGAHREGERTTVTFSTYPGARYRLRFTQSLDAGLPPSSWDPGAGTVIGDGGPRSLELTTPAPQQFISVEALP